MGTVKKTTTLSRKHNDQSSHIKKCNLSKFQVIATYSICFYLTIKQLQIDVNQIYYIPPKASPSMCRSDSCSPQGKKDEDERIIGAKLGGVWEMGKLWEGKSWEEGVVGRR
jgi:hypothetical protein